MKLPLKQRSDQMVLQLCRFDSPSKEQLENGIREGVDWAYVLGQLLYNRMGGTAYRVLRDTGLLGSIGREFRNTLSIIYDHNVRYNQIYQRMLEQLAVLLEGVPFAYAALKGAYLVGAFPEGLRTSNDVDLLVAGRDITPLSKRLVDGGFRQGYLRNGQFFPAGREEILSVRLNRGETVPFVRETGERAMPFLEVDINFSLDYKAKQERNAVEAMLLHTVSSPEAAGLRILDPARFLIHLCAHLYKEATTKSWVDMGRDQGLYKYADLYFLLCRGTVDIETLIKAVVELGQERACTYALSNTRELFGLKRPALDALLEAISPEDRSFMQEIMDPSQAVSYRYDCPIDEWVFDPNRKERLYAVSKIDHGKAEIPGEAHYLQRFGRVR